MVLSDGEIWMEIRSGRLIFNPAIGRLVFIINHYRKVV